MNGWINQSINQNKTWLTKELNKYISLVSLVSVYLCINIPGTTEQELNASVNYRERASLWLIYL